LNTLNEFIYYSEEEEEEEEGPTRGKHFNTLYFRYYTQIFFVSRLIINKINKVQWVDFKLENVLVSLYSLKTMDLCHFGA
jgi:hypothetical protein